MISSLQRSLSSSSGLSGGTTLRSAAPVSSCRGSCRPSTSGAGCVASDSVRRSTRSHHRPPGAAPGRRGCQRQRLVWCRAVDPEDDERADEDGEEDQPTSRIVAELSQMVSDEAVYFMFQLDLDTQLQRCLNYKAYELANEVRLKRQKVDEIIRAMKERKAAAVSAAPTGVSPADGRALLSVADFAAEGLRLRSEMQRAVEDERYADAAKYRDLLARLQTESNKVEAANEEWNGGSVPVLRLGQRVIHREHGYRAVVVGWDLRCCESGEWQQLAGVQHYKRGARQPFYHLLVDMQDFDRFDSPMMMPPVTYVAEELLSAPELEGQAAATGGVEDVGSAARGAGATSSSSSLSTSVAGRSWVEEHGDDGLEHTYVYILFLGQDARGDYIPCRQLRDKYNVPRRDVYRPGDDGTFNAGDDGPAAGGDDGPKTAP